MSTHEERIATALERIADAFDDFLVYKGAR
jgi:hypothetical protein